jgi:acyl CoA:acetate/3-ketoacid CoA transferase beta subunit
MGVVNRIITNLAALDVTPDGLTLVGIAPGRTKEEMQERPALNCAIRFGINSPETSGLVPALTQ